MQKIQAWLQAFVNSIKQFLGNLAMIELVSELRFSASRFASVLSFFLVLNSALNYTHSYLSTFSCISKLESL